MMICEESPKKGELWCLSQLPPTFIVTFLMPNGLVIDMSCCRGDSLATIKQNLWKEAEKKVLFRKLNDMSSYIFVGVNQEGKIEEFFDESRHFCDLGLFIAMLKLILPSCNKEQRVPDLEISYAIGMPLDEIESIEAEEIIQFRKNILSYAESIVIKRENMPIENRAYYLYPPELDHSCLPNDKKQLIDICVWLPWKTDSLKQSCKVQISIDSLVSELIELVLSKTLKRNEMTSEQFNAQVKLRKDKYIVKVCGEQQFLFGNYPLYKYKHFSNFRLKEKCPQLSLINKFELYQSISKSVFFPHSNLLTSQDSCFINKSSRTTWHFDSQFKLKVLSATYVNVRDLDAIYVKLGLYHGAELLCSPVSTKLVETFNPKWNQSIEFDISVANIPRSAILCISICSVSHKKKSGEHCAIAWGNIPLFDYRSRLISELISINLWPMPKDFNELLNPLGNLGSNTNKFSPCLELDCGKYPTPTFFPSDATVEDYGRECRKRELNMREDFNYNDLTRIQSYHTDTPADYELLNEIIKRDPLSELSLQEKSLVWQMREHCLKIPDSLPKLLDSVRWGTRDDVSQLYVLLNKWGKVKTETALELLDCKYADPKVRKFAVGWLDEGLNNELLSSYLLQLVSVLKWERNYNTELAKFLLGRALTNRKIGHYFYWHLKSEVDQGDRLRSALLLEGYCRGIGTEALKETIKQQEAIEKLTLLNEGIIKEESKERIRYLIDTISKDDYREALQSFRNPLNPYVILENLIVNECRIMDSAKKPLWLVWESGGLVSEKNAIIFKSGDDLRQDMLTLQVIKIFDLIWRSEGFDLKMLPYTCLATGKSVGMIEVVGKAKTVMSIQRTGGRMSAYQMDSTALHSWIKEVANSYEKAIDTFTKSCAGYCVATFILGIGDRNPDNIMITEDGQIFHIDFGHFLGHFKKKFGITRERVPFVLTDDFLYVISKGADYPKRSNEFLKFTELCGSAYLSLRKYANLIITLFTMMLSTGIPELQSIDDIGYLRKTLQVEKSEEQALKYFNNAFFEAHGGAWTTKLDWFFHNIAHS